MGSPALFLATPTAAAEGLPKIPPSTCHCPSVISPEWLRPLYSMRICVPCGKITPLPDQGRPHRPDPPSLDQPLPCARLPNTTYPAHQLIVLARTPHHH